MLTVMDKGVKMCCKSATENFFTVVGLIFELITYISKTKIYLKAYLSIV